MLVLGWRVAKRGPNGLPDGTFAFRKGGARPDRGSCGTGGRPGVGFSDVLKRRVPRVLATGFLIALTVSGLSGCRTSPNVAAYVGQEQVTVAELDSAVNQRLEDKDIAAYAKGKEDEFTRRVLSLLVQEEVYAAAAEHFDVQVANDAVRARITELLGTDSPADVYGQLAQQGISREDVFENVRQQLVRQKVAAAEGKGGGLDDASLQARYAEVKQGLAQIRSATSPCRTTPPRPRCSSS